MIGQVSGESYFVLDRTTRRYQRRLEWIGSGFPAPAFGRSVLFFVNLKGPAFHPFAADNNDELAF